MKRLTLLLLLFLIFFPTRAYGSSWWEFQSVDTMKYSRDLAREKNTDKDFEKEIFQQVKDIAATGATHIAIATPYDEEFLPFQKKWVRAARENNLKVWFRGNFAGWEGWFDYPKISREEHIKKTEEFILKNTDLFESGDIFSGCPECENGGPGDPRQTGDVEGHRNFLIQEHKVAKLAFSKIKKNVRTDFNSMNGDVARLIMNPQTTKELGGFVVIDHYVKTADQMVEDIKDLAKRSSGKIVLGEFGAPIPDIHDWESEADQAKWISETLNKLASLSELYGINYWTNLGGSTQIWASPGNPKKGALALENYFKPSVYKVRLVDELNYPASSVLIVSGSKQVSTDSKGEAEVPFLTPGNKATIISSAYNKKELILKRNTDFETITLTRKEEGWVFKIKKFLKNILANFNRRA